MKKHNEGYALALVLVVLVIVCLVAVSILSISLSNLKSQQASIARMQAQYEAQGKIEQVVANLEKDIKVTSNEYKLTENTIDTREVVLGDGTNKIVLFDVDPENTEYNVVRFKLTAETTKSGYKAIVVCEIQLTGDKSVTQSDLNGVASYGIKNPKISYISYEITTTETGEEAGS